MYTPFEILQLKQKQRKYQLNISQQKHKKTFCLKFQKQMDLSTKNKSNQSFVSNKKIIEKKQHQIKDLNEQNRSKTSKGQKRYKSEQPKNKQKKYEIICRQSIRKVNTYRARVYHTHKAFKDQTFFLKLNSLRQKRDQLMQAEQKQEDDQVINERKLKTADQYLINNKLKDDSNDKTSIKDFQVTKFKILFDKTIMIQAEDIGLDVPQFLVQKCKLNPTDQRQKQRIQKAIQKLYDRNIVKNCQNHQVIHSVKNSNKKLQQVLSQNPQNNGNIQRNKILKQKQLISKNISLKQNTNSLIQNYHQKDLSLYQTHNSMNQYNQQQEQNQLIQTQNIIQGKDLMNFIKKSKKRRLPVSRNFPRKKQQNKFKNNSFIQFRRTITEDCNKRQSLKNSIQIANFRKNSISPTKIKFNTIEQKISGWQIDHLQAQDSNTQSNVDNLYKK